MPPTRLSPTSRHGRWLAAAIASVSLGLGCKGEIGEAGGSMPSSGVGPGAAGSGSGSGGTGLGGQPGTPSCVAGQALDPGRVTLRRLNRTEYNNTVHDLLGDTTHPADAFPDDTGGGNFDNNGDVLSTSPLLFEKLEAAAGKLATTALTAGTAQRAAVVTCDPATAGESACASEVVKKLARRAWRRPVTAAEVSQLAGLVTLARSNGDSFDAGVTLAVEAILLSPHFMFRPELDPDPAATTPRLLTGHEMASRLSYFLWSSMPDDTLFAAADAGTLQSVTELQRQATRMLADPRAATLLSNMAAQWFSTYKLATVSPAPAAFPAFDEPLRAAMVQETEMFLKDVLLGAGSLLDLVAAPYTYANARLAQHYGLPAVSGSGFQKVSLIGTQRLGLLTQASVLTVTSPSTRTSPVKRGEWILSNLLCQPTPPPPDNVPPLDATMVDPGASVRTRLEQHRKNPACAACHNLLDPLGFALEHFDGIGRWRDKDGTASIDATGALPDGTTFDGAQQLAAVLAQRPAELAACATQKVFSFALGRDPVASDACALQTLSDGLAANDYAVPSLILAVVGSDAFRMRQPAMAQGRQP